MRALHISGRFADIWHDVDVTGKPLGHQRVTWGPQPGLTPWQFISHGIRLWFSERWPFQFRCPVTEVREG